MAMRLLIIGFSLVIVALAATLGVVTLGGGVEEGTLEARAIAVEVKEGKIVQGNLEAARGEIVTLRIAADEPWLFHIHGVEVADKVGPDQVLLLPFEANEEGRFEIGLHSLARHDDKSGDMGTRSGDHGDGEDVTGGYISVLPK